MFDTDSIDLATILEEAEPAIDAYLDTVEDEDADIEMTTGADEVDDITLDAVIGVDGVISDKDIEDIEAGKVPQDANNTVDDDADEAEEDPEIFKLQRDVTQNTLLTPEDIKEIKEGMSIEEFTLQVLQEQEDEVPVEGEQSGGVCPECNCSPCVCDVPNSPGSIEVKSDETKPVEFSIDKALGDDSEDKPKLPNIDTDDLDFHLDLDLDDDDHDDHDLDDDDHDDDFKSVDDINAPDNVPAGPVQPLFDNNATNEDSDFEDSIDAALIGLEMDLEMIDDSDINEEGDVSEMNEREYNEGYAQGVDDAIEAILEELEDSADNDEIIIEDSVEGESEDTSMLEDIEVEGLDDLDALEESLNDLDKVEIFNKFEGSGINDKQWGPDDFLVGPDGNVDERGLGSNQNDDSLQFDGKTVTGFDNMDEDPSIDDMRIR